MHWLLLLIALAALAVAFKTTSVPVLVICLLLALALALAWVMKLLAQRVDSQSRDSSMMLDPMELRRLREQAEARRSAAGSPPGTPPAA
ncbi:hypothetical protein MNR01_10820 [Lysobacter sp. S4-A87]|uniref:hypothetical protein n=1 Tax=Lysobacter sp. S4-A87 TaxID=2925843 RepID=UPI001F53A728|nr:hypothetical protein [Lysobacter sp. S4-A87]UNK48265.1 hypothetical protein MNR01_10820 [Lysobacter sp. S4-A87]